MPKGNSFAGKGSLRVDGVVYNCKSLKVYTGGDKGEMIVGMGGPAGMKLTPTAPKIEATILKTPEVLIETIKGWREVDAEVECGGQSGTVEKASLTNPPTWDTETGEIDVEIEGFTFTEAGV